MSDDRGDWENSAAAQRRKLFFEGAPSDSSRLSDPPRDAALPERPRRRHTPHPRAGTSGLDSQQQSDVHGSNSGPPSQSVDQRRQVGDEYGGGRGPTSYDEETQDHSRRLSQSRPTRMDLSRDEFERTPGERFTEQDDIGSLEASSHTEKGKSAMRSGPRKPSGGSGTAKKVTIKLSDEVRYPKHHSPGSSPESIPDSRQVKGPGQPSSSGSESGEGGTQVGPLGYQQTDARDAKDWEASEGEQPMQRRRDGGARSRQDEGRSRTEDTIRYKERRDEFYTEGRGSGSSYRTSGERSEERERRDDSHERRARARAARNPRDSGQGGTSSHYGRRRAQSKTPPGKIERFKNYITRSKK